MKSGRNCCALSAILFLLSCTGDAFAEDIPPNPLQPLSEDTGSQLMQTIIEELDLWVFQARTVDLTWTSQAKFPPADGRELPVHYQRLVWSASSRGYEHNFTLNNGLATNRTLSGLSDGHWFMAEYRRDHSEKHLPAVVKIFPSSRRTMTPDRVPFFLGMWFPLQKLWLPDLLAEGKGVLVGHRYFQGVLCPELHLRLTQDDTGGTIPEQRYSLLLHPGCDYLPCYCEWHEQRTMTVTGFHQERSFGLSVPQQGTYSTDDGTRLFRVEAVTINGELEESLFQPPIGEGTLVMSPRAGKGPWINGSKAAHLKLRDEHITTMPLDRIPVQTGESEAPNASRVLSGIWSFPVFLIAVLVVLGVHRFQQQKEESTVPEKPRSIEENPQFSHL